MNSSIDDFKNQWQSARQKVKAPTGSGPALIAQAKSRKRKSLYFHYGNLVVLILSLIAITYIFQYYLGFRNNLSHWGVGLMLTSLGLRILIELFSLIRWMKIAISDHTLKNTDDSLAFYRFRQRIHGPVTLSIVAAYSLGFYLLTPEFYQHIPLPYLILMDLSYLLGAAIILWQVRKGIQRELQQLREIVAVREQMQTVH